jgi:poly(3-hydroxybutyrate) depolymerase
MHVRITLALALIALSAPQARSDDYRYYREEFRLQMSGAGPRGLEAVIVRPSEPGRYPLVLLSHGSTSDESHRRDSTPLAFILQALAFARRGWAGVAVLRPGYGDSGGRLGESLGTCADPRHLEGGRFIASQLRAIIAQLAKRPDIDASRILLVGTSAGGFGSLALAADPPAGLAAVVNFAGGRGAMRDGKKWSGKICNEQQLLEAFRAFGRSARVPTLWVYSDNDQLWGPVKAEVWRAGFTQGGGRAELIKAPAFSDNGHNLLTSSGAIATWMPFVDRFLDEHALAPSATLRPAPTPPHIAIPDDATRAMRQGLSSYLAAAPHKAFAVVSDGGYQWWAGARTKERAKQLLLETCKERAKDCRVTLVDEEEVR